MAKVPSAQSLGSPTASVGPTVFQSPVNDPNAFGANIGQAIEGSGAQLAQTGEVLFNQAIEDGKREEALLQVSFNEKLISLEQEFNALRGEDAVEAEEGFLIRVKEIRDEVANTSSNNWVAKRFGLKSSVAEMGTVNRIINTTRKARIQAEDDKSAAVITEAHQRAVELSENTDEVFMAAQQAGVAARDVIERAGGSVEAANTAMEAEVSSVFRGAIESNLVKRKTSLAKEQFDFAAQVYVVFHARFLA